LSFWILLLCVAVFLIVCGYGAFIGVNKANLHLAFLGGLSGFAATAIGAAAAIALRDIAARTQDIMLGFAAGMMLAASSFSLILPGIGSTGPLRKPIARSMRCCCGIGIGRSADGRP
jgi:ZIP family zinc transporter